MRSTNPTTRRLVLSALTGILLTAAAAYLPLNAGWIAEAMQWSRHGIGGGTHEQSGRHFWFMHTQTVYFESNSIHQGRSKEDVEQAVETGRDLAASFAATTRASPFVREASLPRWSSFPRFSTDELITLGQSHPLERVDALEVASGWPFRAVTGILFFQLKKTNELRYMVRTADLLFPFRPLWPGLLANMLFWSALSFAAFTSASALRRTLRLRRNLCPHCAYNLTATPPNTPCPECGNPRSA